MTNSKLLAYEIDPENGCYLDSQGCHNDTIKEIIMHDILGFCGCGDPDSAFNYVFGVLHLMHKRSTENRSGLDIHSKIDSWSKWTKVLERYLPKHWGAYWFVLYILSDKDLLEHGGSCGGSWLSEYGEKVYYTMLDELKKGN